MKYETVHTFLLFYIYKIKYLSFFQIFPHTYTLLSKICFKNDQEFKTNLYATYIKNHFFPNIICLEKGGKEKRRKYINVEKKQHYFLPAASVYTTHWICSFKLNCVLCVTSLLLARKRECVCIPFTLKVGGAIQTFRLSSATVTLNRR